MTWLTASNSQGQCVETSRIGENVAMRDSQDREGPMILFTPFQWADFIGKIKQDIPVFEKINAFDTPPERGPKGDYTVLFMPVAPWVDHRLYYTEPELDAFVEAVKAGRFDYEEIPSVDSFSWIIAEVPMP